MTTIRVGGTHTSLEKAEQHVREYVTNTGRRWAYPAYDGYPGHDGPELGAADLLAPALLNAQQNPIGSYYGFESILDVLNERLAEIPTDVTLDVATADTLEKIAQLYGVLDTNKPKYISLTKLSKALHRKRPGLLPLYDRNIRHCYVYAHGAPVPDTKNRSWTDLTRLWVAAVQADLTTQLDQWTALAGLATGPTVTPLRALDIVGWYLGDQRGSGEWTSEDPEPSDV
jgi:hypothetical protein